jgi:hypothetical protein
MRGAVWPKKTELEQDPNNLPELSVLSPLRKGGFGPCHSSGEQAGAPLLGNEVQNPKLTSRALMVIVAGLKKRAQNQEGRFKMPKASSHKMLHALKNSLRDLESVRMTAQDDPELLALKKQIHKMIERLEGAAKDIASRLAPNNQDCPF